MTDHLSARADELLTELIELVETARSLPMSTSCVVPRERTLDLLDGLREVLPPEIEEARSVVASRDDLLSAAQAEATALTAAAQLQAEALLEHARAEQADLVAASSVHQVATLAAVELRTAAERAAAARKAEAEAEAEELRANSRDYADRTLSELIATLTRLTGTAENGRQALGGAAPSAEVGRELNADRGSGQPGGIS